MRYVRAPEFLTEDEIQLAARMWVEDKQHYANRVCEKIIRPNIARINRSLGQENDPWYLAHALEFVMMEPVPGKTQ
jgi:hypothetical protein